MKLFIGIELDERTREQCAHAAQRLRDTGFATRFEPAEKYHVTVAFLGWLDGERLTEVRTALDRAVLHHAPFRLSLDRLSAFPHERRPRVVWAGSRMQDKRFRALALAVRSAYAERGFSFKEDVLAHVTLARIKAANTPLPMLEVTPIRLRVGALALFESVPAGATTRYTVLHRAELRGERASEDE